jgi:hypothetical protein
VDRKDRQALAWLRERLRARRRVLRTVAAVLAAVAVAGGVLLLVWALPSLLTRHPHIPGAVDRHKAITDTRTGLIALATALGAGAGLAYTARTYRLSREGHITDRYTKAVDQLGAMDKLAVRLGGIYALERIAVDSERDHRIVVEVLSAFVREHDPPTATDPTAGVTGLRILSDVQTAVTVLGRLPQRRRIPRVDLGDAHLERANLPSRH